MVPPSAAPVPAPALAAVPELVALGVAALGALLRPPRWGLAALRTVGAGAAVTAAAAASVVAVLVAAIAIKLAFAAPDGLGGHVGLLSAEKPLEPAKQAAGLCRSLGRSGP